MPTLLPLLAALALAAPADPAPAEVYRRALGLIDDLALDPSACTDVRVRHDLAAQLEADVAWLRVEEREGEMLLAEGDGTDWRVGVPLDLPRRELLARLDAALRTAPRPLSDGEDVHDPRVVLLRGAIRCLDRHSVVLADRGLARFDERMGGTLSGVGATIGRERGRLRVKALVDGGPAERAGLRVGDDVLAVDGLGTSGMGVDDLTARIRGPAGTTVTLGVERAGMPLALAVTREGITIRNVHRADGPHGVDVVRIDHFSEQTRGWLHEVLAQRVAAGRDRTPIVLDLRGNTGGSLLQSAEAADVFVDEGALATTLGRDGGPVRGLAPRLAAEPGSGVAGVSLDGVPVVVLVDARTASGAEILAGALRERGRAVVVGAQTFGKGTVQKVYPLADGVKLKLTVAEYRVGDGVRVADTGLSPDVLVDTLRVEHGAAWHADPRVDARAWDVPRVTMLASDEDGPLRLAARIARAGAEVDAWQREHLLPVARQQAALAALWADGDVARALAPLRGAVSPPPEGTRVDETSRVALEALPRGADGSAAARVRLVAGARGHPAGWLALRSEGGPWDGARVPVDVLAPGETRDWTLRVPQEDDAPERLDRVEAIVRTEQGTVTPLGSGVLASGGEAPPALAVRVRTREGAEGKVDLDLRVGTAAAPAAGVSLALPFPDLEGPLRDLAEVRVAETPALVAGPPGAEADAVLGLRWRGDGARPALPLALRLRAGDHAWTLPFTLPGAGASRGADQVLAPPVLTLTCGPEALPCALRSDADRLPLVVRVDDDGPLASLALDAGVERVRWRNGVRVVDVAWRRVAWRDLSLADDGRAGGATRRWTVPLEVGAHRLRVVAVDAQGLRQVRTLVVARDATAAGAGGVTGGGQPPVP